MEYYWVLKMLLDLYVYNIETSLIQINDFISTIVVWMAGLLASLKAMIIISFKTARHNDQRVHQMTLF